MDPADEGEEQLLRFVRELAAKFQVSRGEALTADGGKSGIRVPGKISGRGLRYGEAGLNQGMNGRPEAIKRQCWQKVEQACPCIVGGMVRPGQKSE